MLTRLSTVSVFRLGCWWLLCFVQFSCTRESQSKYTKVLLYFRKDLFQKRFIISCADYHFHSFQITPFREGSFVQFSCKRKSQSKYAKVLLYFRKNLLQKIFIIGCTDNYFHSSQITPFREGSFPNRFLEGSFPSHKSLPFSRCCGLMPLSI